MITLKGLLTILLDQSRCYFLKNKEKLLKTILTNLQNKYFTTINSKKSNENEGKSNTKIHQITARGAVKKKDF